MIMTKSLEQEKAKPARSLHPRPSDGTLCHPVTSRPQEPHSEPPQPRVLWPQGPHRSCCPVWGPCEPLEPFVKPPCLPETAACPCPPQVPGPPPGGRACSVSTRQLLAVLCLVTACLGGGPPPGCRPCLPRCQLHSWECLAVYGTQRPTPRRSTAALTPGPSRLPSGRVCGCLSLTLSAPTPSHFSQWEHPQASHVSPQLKVLALCLSSVKSFLS